MTGPALRTARRAGLIDQVIEQLREQITSGAWAVGSRIPTEPELAATMGTGRNTVREAVQALVHAGLLERRQGAGTFVRADSELPEVVARHLAASARRDVLEARHLLEVGAARLAAARRTTSDVARMRGLIAARIRARRAGDDDAVVAADVDLHRAIVAASHNPLLIDLYESFGADLRANIQETMAGQFVHDDEHAALVEAIEDGEVDRAAAEASHFLTNLLSSSAGG